MIRLTERFVKSDPLERRRRAAAREASQSRDGRLHRSDRERGFDRVIGTSGTILSLGAVAASEDGDRAEDLRNRRVSAEVAAPAAQAPDRVDIEERLATPGMDPRRADLSVAGSVLFDTIIRRLGADEFTLCDLALREGLVLDYIHRNSARIRKVERYPDVRRRSIVELGERCGYWSEHAQQVARLALNIFDQTRSVHGLSDREREWLEYGALLHDVGVHISYERHHRHSYYLIKNGDLRGFDPQEIEVDRAHRPLSPAGDAEEIARRLRRSAGIDAQDASRRCRRWCGWPRGSIAATRRRSTGIDLYPRGDDYLARLRATGDAELELWAAHRHVAPLEELLGKPVRFEVAGSDTRADTRQRRRTSC